MREKIYVGTFEFDKEDLCVLVNSVKFYKEKFPKNAKEIEICDYLLTRLTLKYLKVEKF